jgi:TusA-related sulfurtransferase
MNAKKILEENKEENTFNFLVDCGASVDNVTRLARSLGFEVESMTKEDGVELKVMRKERRVQ